MITDHRNRRVGVRRGRADDQAYVARSWVSSVLDGYGVWHQKDAIANLNREVDRLLDDPLTKVLIACPDEDDGFIVGFVVYANRTLLYVKTRNEDRKRGIAKLLLGEARLLANGKPLLYVYEGPSAKWAASKRPDAVKISLEEHLA